MLAVTDEVAVPLWAILLLGLATPVLSLVGVILTLSARRRIGETHALVNSKSDAQVAKIEGLEQRLRDFGIENGKIEDRGRRE